MILPLLATRIAIAFLTKPSMSYSLPVVSNYLTYFPAELGDFLEDEYTDHRYLQSLKLLPVQTEDIEIKIMEHHKEHM